MKKILFSLAVASLLTGCYKDEGNYDYSLNEMNEIKSISYIPAGVQGMHGYTVELQQPLNESERVRRIEVNLEQTLDKDFENLDFKWLLSYTNEEQERVTDTLDTKGYLEVTLPIGKQMNYEVLLEVKDRNTTLSRFSKFLIQTRPIFKNSLYFLHGTPGQRKIGNVGTIGTETSVYADAFKVVNPNEKNPFENSIGLAHTAYLNNDFNSRQQYEVDLMSVYNANGTTTGYNPFGFTFKYPTMFMMQANDGTFVYSRNVETGDPSNTTYYRCVLSRNGQFMLGNFVPRLYIPGLGAAQEGNPLHQTDYMVTAATITESRFVLWDAKNERFLYVSKNDGFPWTVEDAPYRQLNNPVMDAHVDFSGLSEANSLKGKRAVYAYIQYRENYESARPYFIFKDDKTGKFYQYELTSLSNGDKKSRGYDGEEGGAEPVFAISAVKQMKNFNPGENLNNIIYNSWFTTNYLFYANEGNVYRYNLLNGDKTVLYTAPSGYTVSTMKFRTYVSSNFAYDLGRFLSIGLVKGNEGAIAEIKLTTASDVDTEFKPTFYDKDDEGNKFGPIVDLQFTQEYMYKVGD